MDGYRTLRTVVLAAALLGACDRSASSPTRLQPPKIMVETTHDFGRVEPGARVAHVYEVRNAGGLDLTIDNVRATCECTAAPTSARVIPPGGTGAIAVSFDSTHAVGHQSRSITVYSNDPAQPVTTLTLVGDVDTDAAAAPPRLYVGRLQRGQTAPNEVRVLGGDSIAASGTVCAATLHGGDPRAKEKRMRVAIKPDAPLGRFTESVSVRTTSARRPVLTIPVTGIVEDIAPAAEKR